MDINVSGVINVTSLCVPHMRKASSGHIIAVSSFCGIPFNSIYSASKCAVEGYCESIKEELLADGVRLVFFLIRFFVFPVFVYSLLFECTSLLRENIHQKNTRWKCYSSNTTKLRLLKFSSQSVKLIDFKRTL